MGPPEENLADQGSFAPIEDGLGSTDPLEWPDYEDARGSARDKSGADESVVAGPAVIGKTDVELALFRFEFMGGSMGEVTGERLARAMERAAERAVPFVLRTSTGGARMQEGMRSLVQMPKVVIARTALTRAHVPFICVLGHPTTGGVLASIAALSDITVAEADATIGFAGPRVAERVTGEPVDGSHTSTTAFAHGLVDEVVPASDAKTFVAEALRVLGPDQSAPVSEMDPTSVDRDQLDAWDAVKDARAPSRPEGTELLRGLSDSGIELRGDRAGSDDPALTCALLRIHGRRCMAMALNRSHLPGPGAYKKARRCLEVAERLDIPVATLIDTPGADPSSESENAGVAWEIAKTFEAFLDASVPTLSVVTGEGGSGGALAFASTDVLLAMQASIFSVIGPESAAEILWREAGRASDAARLLKLTAQDLLELGIADGVIPEPCEPGRLSEVLAYHLDRLRERDGSELLSSRRERWRRRNQN